MPSHQFRLGYGTLVRTVFSRFALGAIRGLSQHARHGRHAYSRTIVTFGSNLMRRWPLGEDAEFSGSGQHLELRVGAECLQEPADMVAYGGLGKVEFRPNLPGRPARGKHL